MRVVVVGAGAQGKNHVLGWRNSGKHEIAVADIDSSRAEALVQEFGLQQKFADYKEAIETFEPQAVSICTPTSTHKEVFRFSVEHGAHVLVEKPLALTLEDGREMVGVAQKTDLKTALGFHRRLSSSTPEISRILREHFIGLPVVFSVEAWAEVRYKLAMHSKKMNGGPLIDYSCHLFDLLHVFTGGEPTSVYAVGGVFAKGKKEVSSVNDLAVDTASLIVKYDTGDWLSLDISWGLPRGLKWGGSEQIHGSLGSITGDLSGLFTLQHMGQPPTQLGIAGEKLYEKEVRAFDEWIHGSKQSVLATFADGLRALRVSLAALRSVDTGRTVEIRASPSK